jgi:hypothetical protein
MDNKGSGTGVVTMAKEGGGAHTWNRAIRRGVLTIRTIRWEIITRGGGCDSISRRYLPSFLGQCLPKMDKISLILILDLSSKWFILISKSLCN